MNILSSIMHNNQKVEPAQMSIDQWRDKQGGISIQGNITHLWKEMKY